jgi:hypothetical protein
VEDLLAIVRAQTEHEQGELYKGQQGAHKVTKMCEE